MNKEIDQTINWLLLILIRLLQQKYIIQIMMKYAKEYSYNKLNKIYIKIKKKMNKKLVYFQSKN